MSELNQICCIGTITDKTEKPRRAYRSSSALCKMTDCTNNAADKPESLWEPRRRDGKTVCGSGPR
jgi:hypothetical protein